MVLKRNLWGREEEGSDSSEFRKREFKRKYGLPSLLASVNRTSPQELVSILEPFIRTCIREEIELSLKKYLRPPLNDTISCGSRFLKLCFENNLPSAIFTGCKVESENFSPIKVVLRDVSTGKTVTSGPLSSVKLTLVVLDGDLNPDEFEDFTLNEFNKRTVREREGKRPLVTGTRSLTLIHGVGYVEDISFTDNSSWIRSGKFRLGVKVQNNTNEIGIEEGISNAFKVLDQRGEAYKKNHPPSLVDEVWRLEKIAKDGPSHKRLSSNGIFTVKDFLRLYHTDSSFLRSILGRKTSNKIWDLIIGHAKECCLDKEELYTYSADDGTRLFFNSIYEAVGVILDGHNFQYMHELPLPQKRMIETLKLYIYKNPNHLVPLGGESFFTSPLQSSCSQSSCFSDPSIMLQNVKFAAKQDEHEMQMNSCPIFIPSMHAHGFDDKNELQVSVTETCDQIGECSPTFTNDILIDGSFSGGQTLGFDWDDTGFSLGYLDSTCPHIFNDNFQMVTPAAWKENNFIVAPGNEEFGLMASNLNTNISRSGRTKICWCKIRAVVKWQMMKSGGKKNGKAF